MTQHAERQSLSLLPSMKFSKTYLLTRVSDSAVQKHPMMEVVMFSSYVAAILFVLFMSAKK